MSEAQLYLPEIQAIADRNKVPPPHRVSVIAQLPINLPGWDVSRRGTPNSFLRCSLFAATKGTERAELKDEVLASPKGLHVKYSGMQLNQSDLDVWETLVHLARQQPLGGICSFTTYQILKTLGHKTVGNSEHKWVDGIIKRLTKTYIEITHDNYPDVTYFGHLIEGGKKNAKTKRYDIKFNTGLLSLYDPAHWTSIDWEQRKALRGQDLAKYLHAFYSTHREPLAMAVATFHALTGSLNPQLAGFKRQLAQALQSLKRIGFLKNFSIEKGIVSVERNFARSPLLTFKED